MIRPAPPRAIIHGTTRYQAHSTMSRSGEHGEQFGQLGSPTPPLYRQVGDNGGGRSRPGSHQPVGAGVDGMGERTESTGERGDDQCGGKTVWWLLLESHPPLRGTEEPEAGGQD